MAQALPSGWIGETSMKAIGGTESSMPKGGASILPSGT
eukprot:CAMPEP_0201285708 /NCGR_PEP_ID=MMETSP1317-20130820/113709_1 /ASSEMBLY_ACC=CAM_ASM_000770 /TAXON_ID=187299 /ORGANISM="Undescribed Undescribed, Strain Undescribed" /LENGTH=37 /DNA_ID= /DNA_START= /DNA_END= /DNA_ORIENTATION=